MAIGLVVLGWKIRGSGLAVSGVMLLVLLVLCVQYTFTLTRIVWDDTGVQLVYPFHEVLIRMANILSVKCSVVGIYDAVVLQLKTRDGRRVVGVAYLFGGLKGNAGDLARRLNDSWRTGGENSRTA